MQQFRRLSCVPGISSACGESLGGDPLPWAARGDWEFPALLRAGLCLPHLCGERGFHVI